MKLIFARKPGIYFLYFFIFLFIEYLFFNLFLASSENKCEELSNIEKTFIKTKNEKIEADYKEKIEKLENELKKSRGECDKNSQRIDKIARFNDANKNDVIEQCEGENVGSTFIRDFYHYDCKNIVRYPGSASNIDVRKRLDGAYYACEDGGLKLKHSDCIVLSFGIYNNDMFDESVNRDRNCLVHSMDP